MLLWGNDNRSVEKHQKKAIRNITAIYLLIYTEPLLKDLGLLKVGDIFKLRLLKFYYKLMNNELPSYFMTYVPIITNEAYILNHDYALRTGARPAIPTPRIHQVFTESTVLYILIKLLNSLYLHEPNMMSAIQNGTHSYFGFCFYAKQIFLQQYTYTCNNLNCYTMYMQGRPQDLAGGGGPEFFFSDLEIYMSRSDMLRMAKPCALLGSSGACSPEKIF